MKKRSICILTLLLATMIALVSCQKADTSISQRPVTSSEESAQTTSSVKSETTSSKATASVSKSNSSTNQKSIQQPASSKSSTSSTANKSGVVSKQTSSKSPTPSKKSKVVSSKPRSSSSKSANSKSSSSKSASSKSSSSKSTSSKSKSTTSSKSEDFSKKPDHIPGSDFLEGAFFSVHLDGADSKDVIVFENLAPWKYSSVEFVPTGKLTRVALKNIHYSFVEDKQVNTLCFYYYFNKFSKTDPELQDIDKQFEDMKVIVHFKYGNYTCTTQVMMTILDDWVKG